MKTVSIKSISIAIPDNWEYEYDKRLSIYNPVEGVGVIQISFYLVNGELISDLKKEFTDMLSFLNVNPNEKLIKLKKWFAYYEKTESDKFWIYSLFLKQEDALFITYNCDLKDKNLELEMVYKIIKSIIKKK